LQRDVGVESEAPLHRFQILEPNCTFAILTMWRSTPVGFPLGNPIQLDPDSGISATKPADKYGTLQHATRLSFRCKWS